MKLTGTLETVWIIVLTCSVIGLLVLLLRQTHLRVLVKTEQDANDGKDDQAKTTARAKTNIRQIPNASGL